MSESLQSPLARLVLFLICLSVLGGIVAGAHYYAVDLPKQQDVQAPENVCIYRYGDCKPLYYNHQYMTMCCRKSCCMTQADCEIT